MAKYFLVILLCFFILAGGSTVWANKDFEKFKGLKSCLHHLVQQDLQPLCDDMRKVKSVFWQRLYDCVRNCHIDWQAFGRQRFEDEQILSEFLKEQNHEFWEPILGNEQTGKVAADEVSKTQHTCNLNV